MVSPLKISTLIISSFLSVSTISPARPAPATQPSAMQDQTAQLESTTGRIASVQGNSFTLEPQQSQTSGRQQFQQDAEKVMTFTVDQSTTIEGKIEVGADADVTYREQDGNNIAVSVRVSPPQ
jgi:hypothetical protein